MRKGHFFAGMAVAMLLVASVVFLSSCQAETKPEKKPVKKAKPAGEVPDVASVDIRDFAFNPDTVTIAKGGTVTWTNRDYVPHTVTGEDFDSGNLTTSKTFRRTFETPGTYEYKCTIHPSMTGKVVVK